MLGSTTIENARKRTKYAAASMLLALAPSIFAQGSKTPGLAPKHTIEALTIDVVCPAETYRTEEIANGYIERVDVPIDCDISVEKPKQTKTDGTPIALDLLIEEENTKAPIYNRMPLEGRSPRAHNLRVSPSKIGMKIGTSYRIYVTAETGSTTDSIVQSTKVYVDVKKHSGQTGNLHSNQTSVIKKNPLEANP